MKNIKFLFLFVVVLFGYSSCTDEADVLVPNFESDLYFPSSSASIRPLYVQGSTAKDTVEVLVLGKSSGALTSNVSVVDSLTTAIAGVHYRLLTESVSIASGSYSADIIVEVIFDGFESPDDLKTLTLSLDAGTSDNNSITLTLGYNCVSEIPLGTYIEGSSGNNTEVTLTKTGDNVYVISNMNFDYYSPDYADIPGTFVDVCGTLTLQGVAIPEAYDIAWIGSGTYNAAAGTLTFDHSDATYNAGAIQTIVFTLK